MTCGGLGGERDVPWTLFPIFFKKESEQVNLFKQYWKKNSKQNQFFKKSQWHILY